MSCLPISRPSPRYAVFGHGDGHVPESPSRYPLRAALVIRCMAGFWMQTCRNQAPSAAVGLTPNTVRPAQKMTTEHSMDPSIGRVIMSGCTVVLSNLGWHCRPFVG